MTDDEKQIIRDFALGNSSKRDEAIRIHRADIRARGLRRGDPFFDFMSEIDNPFPDLLLRSRYRRQVMESKP